jgi:Txe/YoeB family toxin of toxin-antitoxin system
MWKIKYEKRVQQDWDKLKKHNHLQKNVKKLIETLKNDPFTPKFEKLRGDLEGLFSRRINLKHRLLYKVLKSEETVLIISMWSHYDD